MRDRGIAVLAGLVVTAGLALGAASANAQQIGRVATSTQQMQGQAPGGGLTALQTGSTVVANHRIVTDASGRGQLLFLDESTLSVASQSEIVLDRFVYDPGRGAGDVGLTLTRGALRFIGGKATDGTPAEINTPTGTLSVRGSSTLVTLQNGRTIAVFIAGDKLCFAPTGGNDVCTNRPGGTLGDDGYLGKIDPQTLARLIGQIDGAGGGGGGTFGSGIVNQNPNNRGPVSSKGESYDEFGPDSVFESDTQEGILPPPDDVFEEEEEDYCREVGTNAQESIFDGCYSE